MRRRFGIFLVVAVIGALLGGGVFVYSQYRQNWSTAPGVELPLASPHFSIVGVDSAALADLPGCPLNLQPKQKVPNPAGCIANAVSDLVRRSKPQPDLIRDHCGELESAYPWAVRLATSAPKRDGKAARQLYQAVLTLLRGQGYGCNTTPDAYSPKALSRHRAAQAIATAYKILKHHFHVFG